jgi:adenylosuccinate synthase
LLGPGVLVNSEILLREAKDLGVNNRLGLDPQCAIIEQKHIIADREGHLKEKICTTGTGTGPCNADRALRVARLARDVSELSDILADVPEEINTALDEDEHVLIEGTQGTFISLYHGTYPYVTSDDVCSSATCSDVGVGPTRVDEVVLVCKAYVTRVGAGHLPGEISLEDAKGLGWDEYGTVTGRQRRAAPFNFDLARRAAMINGATQIALTKIDILYPECKGVMRFNDLSPSAIKFIDEVEDKVGLPVTLVGTGPGVKEIIHRC